MNRGLRHRLPGLVRLLVCIAAVTWLVTHTNWSELKSVLSSADWRLVALGVLSFGPAPLLISLRLKWLLEVHDIHLTLWQAIKVTFAGNFIISALPVGTSGGDAVKAFYIARDTHQKHEAVTTVFFDRVIGVVSLVLLSGVMVLLDWHNPAYERWGRIIGILVLALVAGAAIYFSQRLRKLFLLDDLVARLPLAAHFQRIDRALLAFRHRKLRLFACLLLTMALQGVGVLSHYLAGWALGMVGESPLHAFPVYLAYIPICFLAGALPLGVMEETFNQLFVKSAGFGTREAAYSLSLLGRAIQMVWAFPGALVVLRGGSFRKMKAMIEEPADEQEVPGSAGSNRAVGA